MNIIPIQVKTQVNTKVKTQVNNKEINNEKYKRKRLYLSRLVTTIQFIAMILQIIKYGTSGKAMVSGWSKVIQNVICGTIMIYLKCSSYDIEFNNRCHVMIFVLQRTILFGGLIFMIYTDSKNGFESFTF